MAMITGDGIKECPVGEDPAVLEGWHHCPGITLCIEKGETLKSVCGKLRIGLPDLIRCLERERMSLYFDEQ